MIKKSERLTKAICNKGFSGNSGILPRSNFGVGGQVCSPQSLTAYSLNRCTTLRVPTYYRCILIKGFVVYIELAELAIFNWNMAVHY